MCGFVGVYHYADPGREADGNLLLRMAWRIRHRGPDDDGVFLDGPLGLAHRRLSIVDLSPAGHQPMPTGDGRSWIAYNGEFYNHRSFRAELEGRGCAFRGTSDTETLLYLLDEHGPDRLREAAGIFALAFWDRASRRLTLARDPLGVKQLYYHDDGRRIVFASEIKALLECEDVPREPDPVAINQYLHFHNALFDRTFLRDVRQVRAGEYLQVTPAGVARRTYWSLGDVHLRGGSVDQNVAELRERLGAVVAEQLMADVPAGTFFSGGIDSSAVASFAARAGMALPCFGVHFTGQGVVDERPYQEEAARVMGLDLHLVTLDGAEFPDDLRRLIYYQDQPVIGHAMFPMDRVSRLASEHVKVCLGGQGADEVFGGYARFALAHPWQVARSMLSRGGRARASAAPAAPAAAGPVGGNLWKQLAVGRNLRRLASNVTHLADWQGRYFENFAVVPERIWQRVFAAPEMVSRADCRDLFRETVARSPAPEPAGKAMHWDMQTFLTGLFHQDDRISMSWSLESRVPFADPRLVEFAFSVPFDLKFRNGASKWLLRQAVADVLPAEVLNRRKVGFDTPASRWMSGQHAGFLRELLLSSSARSRGFWNPQEMEKMLDQTGHPLWFDVVWKASAIEMWARLFLDGEAVHSPPENPAAPSRKPVQT